MGDVGVLTSLQLDANGYPVISHYDTTNGNLKLAVCKDATCLTKDITTVDDSGDVGSETSLQLNAMNGYPVISYYDATNADLKLAVCNDATCFMKDITTVDDMGVGPSTSLQLDANGYPVISYYDRTNGNLKLAVCNDATCSTKDITTVDDLGHVGQYTSLQLNANGYPVISYYDTTNQNLKLAVCNDATCLTKAITTVDDLGNVGLYTSLQLDANGNAVISYLDRTNENLKLAKVCLN
jgi:hypothetical protein